MSDDGRYVAFLSPVTDLLGPLGPDTCPYEHIFIRDRALGRTELVSVTADGAQADGRSLAPDINADGRFVAFPTIADNMVPGSPGGRFQVVVVDRADGSVGLASARPDGQPSNGDSHSAAIDGTGRYVAFVSLATDLTAAGTSADGPLGWDVFRWDRQTGTVELVSADAAGNEGDGGSGKPSISANGRYIVWSTTATNLIGTNDTNGAWDTYVKDMDDGSIERVSVTSDGLETHDVSGWTEAGYWGGVSDAGDRVVFTSKARDLAPGSGTHVFLRTLTGAGTTTWLDPDPTSSGVFPGIAAEGVRLNFSTGARLTSDDPDNSGDLYAYDTSAGTYARVGANITGGATGAESPMLSRNGDHVVFFSGQNLVAGDSGGTVEVFLTSLNDAPAPTAPSTPFPVVDPCPTTPPPTDTTPPTVTGTPDRPPDRNGWYRDPVTIDWTAVDPPYSVGTPTDPPDSVVTAQGAAIVTTSEQSCDPVPNCATGSLTLKMDRTPPILGSVFPAGATIATTDSIVITASASDALSGLTGGYMWVGSRPPAPMDATGPGLSGTLVAGLPPGSYDIRVQAEDAAGNLSSVSHLTLRVTGSETTTGHVCSLRQDALESASLVRVIAEQGRTSVDLCSPLDVNVITPGSFGPKANTAVNLAPGQVATGTPIRSFLIHADRAYNVVKDGDFLDRDVVLQLSQGTILGVIVRDAALEASDLLGASGTIYPTGLAFRGHEVNVRSGKQFLNPRDTLTVDTTRTRLAAHIQLGGATDQIRVITSADAVIDPALTTGVRIVDAPPSLALDAFNTERCEGTTLPSQLTCSKKQDTTNDVVLIAEQVVRDVVLTTALPLDIDDPGTYTLANKPPVDGSVTAGTPMRSHIVHIDRPGPFCCFTPGDFAYFAATITFDAEILGVITRDTRLDTSDVLGAPGTLYPTGTPDRGLDFHLGAGTARDETVTLSADRRTLTIRAQVANGLDQLRVITTTPSAAPFVKAVGTTLERDGATWRLYGASIYHTSNLGGPNDADTILAMAVEGGLNTLRLGEYIEQDGSDVDEIYDEADWRLLDRLLDKMRLAGLTGILDLSAYRNHLVERDKRINGLVARCAPFATRDFDYNLVDPYRPDLADDWARFIAFVAHRVNTVNGIPYREDPTISIVSFAGEPVPPGSEDCGKPPNGAELTAFYDRVMSQWAALDANHLLSNGGLLHTDWEELHGSQSGIDWQGIASVPDNDIPSLHTYPAQIINGVPVEHQTPKFAPYVTSLGKPWFTEEYGWRQGVGDATRAGYYTWLLDRQDEYGSAGSAFWNLGVELADGTFDVSPATPDTWQVVVDRAPL